MGLAPTIVEALNGEVLVLNWTQNFLAPVHGKASDVVVSGRRIDWSIPPAICGRPDGVICFVADRPESQG